MPISELRQGDGLEPITRIPLPKNHILVARSSPLTPDQVALERSDLLGNSDWLTYMALSPPPDFLSHFPNITIGRYLPAGLLDLENWKKRFEEVVPVSDQTRRLLQFFSLDHNTNDTESLEKQSEELYERTLGVINGFFAKHGDSNNGRIVKDSLDFMKSLRGKETRGTGELYILHEARVVLRMLVQTLQFSEKLDDKKDPLQILSPTDLFLPHNLQMLGAILAGGAFHDCKEDFIAKGLAAITRDGNILHLSSLLSGSSKALVFPNDELPDDVIFIMDALTNPEFAPELLKRNRESKLQARRLMSLAQELNSFRSIIRDWGYTNFKICDREDNLSALWKYDPIRYLKKLLETVFDFQPLAFLSWYFSRKDTPLAVSTAFMQLLGATYDDLFGWITHRSDIDKYYMDAEKSGQKPVVVPNLTKAVVFTNDGEAKFFYR